MPLRIQPAVLRAQVVMGRDLLLRTLAFQACFVSAGAVAARFGAAAVAAHQVVLQLWSFLALVLDSLAIAAQSLVGAALGAGELAHAKSVAWRVTDLLRRRRPRCWPPSSPSGRRCFPSVFTDDRSVLDAIGVPWWFMVAQLPVAGIVFALDGVLLGAGDAKFMRNATLISALAGFLPLIWLSLIFGWGLLGIWSGLSTFMVLRLVFVGWRALLRALAGARHMSGRIDAMNRLAYGLAVVAVAGLIPVPQSAAEPTVGTAVHVLIHQSFTEVTDADQCVGTSTLAPVRRGSSVVLSEASTVADTRKVAVGQFFRSRLKDGVCEALYITSAPVMPTFNVQFVGPAGELSPTFGPNPAEPVTDQPGIEQAVRVDLAFAVTP